MREHVTFAGLLGQFAIALEEPVLNDEVLELIDRAPPGPCVDVTRAEVQGDFARARELYAAYGVPTFEAESSLRAHEKLIGSGRPDEAVPFLEGALAFYRSVGATYFVRRAEVLLPVSA